MDGESGWSLVSGRSRVDQGWAGPEGGWSRLSEAVSEVCCKELAEFWFLSIEACSHRPLDPRPQAPSETLAFKSDIGLSLSKLFFFFKSNV